MTEPVRRVSFLARAVVLIALFVSGMAGLMHEVVWAKLLVSLIGNTADSNAVVLIVFMGGLAIGAVSFGKRADTWKKPLTVYALLEIAIGAYSLLIPGLLGFAGGLYESIAGQIFEQTTLLLLLRIALSIVIVLPPAILMGATLPVLARYLIQEVAQTRREVASLYAMNNLGAVFGSGLAGLYLLGEFGAWGALLTATGCNVLAAVFVLLIQFQAEREGFAPDFEKQAAMPEPEPLALYTPAQYRMTLVALLFSGFAALGYEIVFLRVIALAFGSSTYSFTVMLMCFITGISVGSGLISMVNVRRPLVWLGVTQLLVLLSFAPTVLFVERLPYFFTLVRVDIFSDVTAELLSPEAGFYKYQLFKAILTIIALLVPTICIGMSFPLVTGVQARSLRHIGGTVGSTYAWNTVGNVLGVIVTGQVLLNVVGMRGAFEFNLVMSLVAGLCILSVAREWKLGLRLGWVGACAAMLLVYVGLWRDWSDSLNYAFNHLRIRQGPPADYDEEVAREHATASYEMWKKHCLATEQAVDLEMQLEEDENATVLALSMPEVTSLFVNTKPEASCAVTFSDMNTQLLIAHLPALFNPDAKELMMIGYGSGVTLGTAMLHPTIEHADLAEISQAVLDAHPMFAKFNYDVLNDPRLTARQEDARTFLRTSPRTYDIIISEPSNPWFVGVSSLFTQQFFQEAKSKLNEGGILMVWFHQYEMESKNIEMVVRTLHSVFGDNVIAFLPDLADIIFLASPQPFDLDAEAFRRMEERFDVPEIREDLAKIRVFNLATLFAYNFVSPGRLGDVYGPGPLNTDAHLRLEYAAPKSLFVAKQSNLMNYVEAFNDVPGGGQDSLLEQYIAYRATTAEPMSKEEMEIAAGHVESQHPNNGSKLGARVRRLGLALEAESSAGYSVARGGMPDPANTGFVEANNRGVLSIIRNDVERAVPLLARAVELHPENAGARVNYSSAVAKSGDVDLAVQILEEGLELEPDNRPMRLQLARTHMAFDRLDDARVVLEGILQENPESPDVTAATLLGDIYNAEGDTEQALFFYQMAVINNVRYLEAGFKYIGLLLTDPANYGLALEHVNTIIKYNHEDPELLALKRDIEGLISGALTEEDVFGPYLHGDEPAADEGAAPDGAGAPADASGSSGSPGGPPAGGQSGS